MNPKIMSISMFKSMSTAAIREQLKKSDIIITSGKTRIAVAKQYVDTAPANKWLQRPAASELSGKAPSQ